MGTSSRIVIATFALGGLVSAATYPVLFELAENLEYGTTMLHGAVYLIMVNPSTLFTICAFIAGIVLTKTERLHFSITGKTLCWALAASILAFPVGVLALVLVADAVTPPMNSDGLPSDPNFLERAFGDFAFPLGLVAGGFALMAFCWISLRLLLGKYPAQFWRVSATTVFGALLLTSALNLLRAAFDADMYYSLTVSDRVFDMLVYEQFGNTMPLLVVGQAVVGAGIGFWIVRTTTPKVIGTTSG